MPDAQSSIIFSPFTLDISKEQLWRDSQPIALRPKTFAVLRYLVEHRDELVCKVAMQGRSDEGIAQLHEGLAAYRATRAESDRPYFLTLLADTCRAGTRTEEGFAAITKALAMIEQKKGNGLSEAELYRLRGELTLQQKSREQGARSNGSKE